MSQALFHREQYVGVAARLDINHPAGMKACEMEGRGEQVAPAQTPKDGALHAGKDSRQEDRRARIIRKIRTARHFMKGARCNTAARQSLIQFVDTKRDRVVPNAYALDMRDARSQIFKDGGLMHGIQETRESLISSLFVLFGLRESS